MGKPHIYTNIFLVSPNCRSCYMEASSQIQNLLCLLLLHLCSSFFHYLTLNQVSEVGTTDRNGGNYLIATIHRGQKFKETMETSVYKGYKQDKIEMRGDRAEMSDFPLYLNTVAGGLDCRDQTIGGFSFVVKIYALPVVEIIG